MDREELREWRKRNRFTQVDLAKALGVHPMTVSKWETEAREIPPFLSLALTALECQTKGGDKRLKSKTKSKEDSGDGNDLSKR